MLDWLRISGIPDLYIFPLQQFYEYYQYHQQPNQSKQIVTFSIIPAKQKGSPLTVVNMAD